MEWVMYWDGGVEEFETEKEALDAAADAISDCNDGEWCDEVANIFVARVTHRPRMVNEVRKEQLSEDGEYNGRFYSGDYESWCDYEMQPVDEAADEITSLTARLAEAEAELDVERRDRTAAEFELLATRDKLITVEAKSAAEYKRGFIDGLHEYAWWKDGVQYVGSCGTTLKDAIAKGAE